MVIVECLAPAGNLRKGLYNSKEVGKASCLNRPAKGVIVKSAERVLDMETDCKPYSSSSSCCFF
jgi:hypothetical protein